jgi:MFS family permease
MAANADGVRAADPGHQHAWPSCSEQWDDLLNCRTCGLVLLRGFVGIADWVVRRVESIEFVDDRTVRRRVSVDYAVPRDAVVLRLEDGTPVRVLPLALMRRKSMVNFDFRDHDGRPMPLLGLRENQALTLAVVRAWAATLLEDKGTPPGDWPRLPGALDQLLDDLVAGDQAELAAAYEQMKDIGRTPAEHVDPRLTVILERLATNFILFATEPATPGRRRIVKWSYDEPLTLLHSTSSYQGHEDGPCPGTPLTDREPEPMTYGKTGRRQHWWEPDPLLAGLGLQPTLIRFPVPGAELAASFHLEITAPPEVSIVQASLLAGQPNLRFDDNDHEKDMQEWETWRASVEAGAGARRARPRRRPSFDSVGGGYPTVDLHVAEVPYGSLSRAQVELQASPKGWLATAWLAALVVTLILFAAFVGRPKDGEGELATLVLVSYAAVMVTMVVGPDPHVMVTRLLAYLRMLAGVSAALTLAGALAVAFVPSESAHWCLLAAGLLSLVPTIVLSLVWWMARRRLVRDRPPRSGRWLRGERRLGAASSAADAGENPTSWGAARGRLLAERRSAPLIRLSPWEQHLPSQIHDERVDSDFHARLARELEAADYPYDAAVVRLGFCRPGIKVASLESDRGTFTWTHEFDCEFRRLLDKALGAPGRLALVRPSRDGRGTR